MPDESDRIRILKLLAYRPEAVQGGLVDPSSGLIHPFHLSAGRRALSVLEFFALCALSATICAGVAHAGWQFSWKSSILLWIAMVAGIVFHYAVESLKRTGTVGAANSGVMLGQIPRRPGRRTVEG